MRLLTLLWTLLLAAPALGQPVARVQLGHTQSAHFVASPDGRLAVGSAFQEGAFLLWSLEQGRILRLIDRPPGAAAAAFPDATTIRVADVAGLRDLDAASGDVRSELPAPWKSEPGCLQLSPNGRWVAWCEGRRVRVAEVGGAPRSLVRLDSLAGWVRLTDGGLASVSETGRVRVWDLASGEKLADVAADGGPLAADGSALAVRTRDGIEVHALRTGEVRRLAIPGGNPLALSDDGAQVAVQVFGKGTRIVDVDGAERFASPRESYTARFLPDGRALLAPGGGTLLVDPAQGAVVWDVPGRSGPQALAFSGDGRWLALTGADQVSVWGLDALSPRWSRDDLGDTYGSERVAWTAAGRLLHWDGAGVQVLDTTSGATIAQHVTPGAIRDAIPEGEAVWLIGGSEVATWDPANDAVALRYAAPDGAYGLFDAVRRDDLLVARGSVGVYVWRGDDPSPIVTRRRLTAFDLALSPDQQTLAVASWEGVRLVSLPDLRPLGELPTGNVTMSVAWSPDGRQLVSGDVDGRVTLWDVGGARIVAERRLGGSVEDVAFSPSGRHLAAASPRDTALLWDLVSGNDARLASAAGGDWLIHTADGLFDGSRDGAALVAMVDGLDVYGIEQLALRNNRPDLILERVGLGDPDVIAHFRARYERRARRAGLTEASPAGLAAPDARIVARSQEGRELHLTVGFAASGAPLTRADVFVDGVPLRPEGWPLTGDAATLDVAVALSPGANDVEISATDAAGAESARALAHARWEGEAPRVLWYVGLGVSDYADSALDLGFAHKDAEDLAARLSRLQGFDRIEARTWTNEAATRGALDEARAFLAGAAADDVVVVFVAGHGLHARDAEATWYFLTHEADPERLADTAAPFEAVEALLRDVPARKKLLLLDACESGELEEEAPALAALDTAQARGVRVAERGATATAPRPWLWDRERYVYVDLVRRSGAVVLSSSRGGEYSYESAALGNGYFTAELLAALSSDVADADGDGLVSLPELRRYVARAVAERSEDRQHPTVDRDNPRMRLELAPTPP